jgi:beta-N-acetylhexosaminidase
MPRPSPAAPSVARLSVATLSLAEKAAQVLLVGIEGSTLPTKACLELLADLPLGGVILFSFNIPERTIDLGRLTGALQDAAAGAKAGIPLFVAIDHEGGSVFRFPRGGLTRLPPPSEVGRRGPGYARLLGTAAGAELRGLGVNLALAPVVELLSEGNKAVLGGRAYGREPATVDAVARAFIEGLQDSGCAAVAKHFPGNGALDPHRGLPLLDADRVTYERDFLPRFASAIEAGVSGVMLSHVLVPAVDPGRPATLSRAIVAGDLKEGLGFEGFALTDDLFMKALLDSMPIERSAVEALSAGADLLMLSSYTGARRVRDAIVRAVEAGLLPQERLDEAVQRVLAQKMRFQLAEDLDPIRRQARLADFPELVKRNQALVGSYLP